MRDHAASPPTSKSMSSGARLQLLHNTFNVKVAGSNPVMLSSESV